MPKPYRIIPPLSKQDILRFWEKVRIRGRDECWPWTASKGRDGYGHLGLGSQIDGSRGTYYAHRVAWTIAYGPVPAGLCVLHSCDVPGCQDPHHFFLGDVAANCADMMQKGRGIKASGDRHGSRTHPECLARGNRHGSRTHPERTARGERNGRAKLTEQDVRDIRRRYAAGDITQVALAQEYSVSDVTISLIVRHEIWKHVA